MPWRDVSKMDEREEFVRLASREGANRRELCRRFGIHPDTGYKWLARFAAGETLSDRSRRPHTSPSHSGQDVEVRIADVRAAHPAWGARKIARWLEERGIECPAPSTVHAILRRRGLVIAPQGGERAHLRFEAPAPNQLWQMDFKGHFAMTDGGRCHPLTIIDDHSRYNICLAACADERRLTVQGLLEKSFRRYGLPQAFFVDNGNPWGNLQGAPPDRSWTKLGVWLIRLGVDVIHSRPYHPQSRGKNERFHRSLKAEALALNPIRDLRHAARVFARWRHVYNCERPHEALGMHVPASRYSISSRAMPARLPVMQYDEGEIVRIVPTTKDYIRWRGRFCKVPQALRGETVAIRPLSTDGHYGVFFGAHQITIIDLTES